MASRSDVMSAISGSGLVEPGALVLAMLSGGADSVCLVHALQELIGAERLHVLHVNHGLRAAADDDERFCVELCERLGLGLSIERIDLRAGGEGREAIGGRLAPSGNLEALAREARYAAAERVRSAEGLDLIATGHTATDQVETILYRLVSSPGRRALLGMKARRGALIRPLLGVTRDQTRAYCVRAGLPWREDESNLDPGFARNRIRLHVLPELRLVHPAADSNVLATAAELADESELLEQAVDEAIEAIAAGGHPPVVDSLQLAGLPAPLRRLVVRRLAERAAGGLLSLGSTELAAIEQLATTGGSAQLDLGQGVRAVSEYGLIRFVRATPPASVEPAFLPVPGRCRFGEWELACTLEDRPGAATGLGSPDSPALDAGLLAQTLTVRRWAEGDRMRPLGLGGTKTLQDLFVDRKVPRSLRGTLPVVESDGEIAWVAGVAVSDVFKVTDRTTETARFEARAGPDTLGG
jgi:tRNA(Ile)-lysidine synthase